MASSTKHLSTHMYFHMERGTARKPQPSTSGFHQEEPIAPPRVKQGSKESASQFLWDPPHFKEEFGVSSVRHLPSLDTRVIRQDYSRLDDPPDSSYLSQRPYDISPEHPSKPRGRRRTSRSLNYRHTDRDQYQVDTGYHRSSRPLEKHVEHIEMAPPVPWRRKHLNPNSSPTRRYDRMSAEKEIEQDCFIIPTHVRRRFMPASEEGASQPHNMMEITDPKECIIIDFRENAAFASQDLPFPATAVNLTPKEWLLGQLNRQRKAFEWVKGSDAAAEGMLLMNVERYSQFPFVTYLVMNTEYSDPLKMIVQLRNYSIPVPGSEQVRHVAGYEEVATIVRPLSDSSSQRPVSDNTGYILSAFRVFPGEDREKLERNWLTWTGARQIYKCLPKNLGLRRLIFHKKMFPDGGITYVLLCECITLCDHVAEALVFVDHLRARCCGYTALYRVVDVF